MATGYCPPRSSPKRSSSSGLAPTRMHLATGGWAVPPPISTHLRAHTVREAQASRRRRHGRRPPWLGSRRRRVVREGSTVSWWPTRSLAVGSVWPPERKCAGQRLMSSASKRQVAPLSTPEVFDLSVHAPPVCESLLLL